MRRFGFILFALAACGLFIFPVSVMAQETAYAKDRAAVQKLVDDAAELVLVQGAEGLKMLEEQIGEFEDKEQYVFITSESGADLINPAFKDIEGMPVETYSDPAQIAAQKTIVNAVKDKDTAWVEYLWPKPQETTVSRKVAYLRKIMVNGKVRIVGAGFYPEQ
jgi:signal transduction histidine kinase